jgi:predicted component of type VI protein secretion system
MYVGVESSLPADECVKLLTGRLNMKIGSFERVDEIFRLGLRGLAFAYTQRQPRALPESRSLTYFQINREAAPDEWLNVQRSLALAIRLNERLVLGNIDGQTTVNIRLEGGSQTAALQFTLYVVPQALTAGSP